MSSKAHKPGAGRRLRRPAGRPWPRSYGRLLPEITSPPAMVASAGRTLSISTLGLMERTEPSQKAKFKLPPACMLPQARLHWLLPDGVLLACTEHAWKSGISVQLAPNDTSDWLYDV